MYKRQKVLTHEIGHMFGIRHCIFFQCLMNGSNNLPESDSQPLHLCPSCLRKLHDSVGFDPVARYETMAKFLLGNGLEKDAGWLQKRIKRINSKSF